MATGTVKWFNSQKGYGFIQPDGGGGKDVFVHISAVEKAGLSSLNEGAKVSYDIISDRGKESAGNLKVKGGSAERVPFMTEGGLPCSNTRSSSCAELLDRETSLRLSALADAIEQQTREADRLACSPT